MSSGSVRQWEEEQRWVRRKFAKISQKQLKLFLSIVNVLTALSALPPIVVNKSESCAIVSLSTEDAADDDDEADDEDDEADDEEDDE